jgi:hypothetical protein
MNLRESATALPALTTIFALILTLGAMQAHAVDSLQTGHNKSPEPIHLAQQDMTPQDIEKYDDIKKVVRQDRVEKTAKKDATGNDPRVFSNKWMPYYRSTELENGVKQQDLTAFGTFRFNDRVGMFYELPLAQYRDLSDVPGVPAGTDAIGLG